ncbi:hypothetical protein LguiA_013361 [Lonicera macranthoides]
MLFQLSVESNKLKGTIPPSFGNLSSLTDLRLAKYMLEGSIPDSLGQLKRLKYLELSWNQLSGTTPPLIFNLSSIINISLASNQLEGNLPRDLGFLLPNLGMLNIRWNKLVGSIPVSLSNASNLAFLDLSINGFSGGVPIDFGNAPKLYWLSMFENNLGSEGGGDLHFVSSLENCSQLMLLYLDHNNFGGALPHAIANLSTNLRKFCAAWNQLSGVIPTGFGKNRLSGEIPLSIRNLTLLNKLWQILKATNSFSSAYLIGLGSFGSVYKGIIDGPNDLKFVAVKILTVCSSTDYNGNDFKALVYEYMENGSLDTWLYPNSQIDQEDGHEEPNKSLNLLQ